MTRGEFGKQSWQDHIKQYPADVTSDNKMEVLKRIEKQAAGKHEGIVTTAVVQGKPVPPEVLKDYPELAKTIIKEPSLKPIIVKPPKELS